MGIAKHVCLTSVKPDENVPNPARCAFIRNGQHMLRQTKRGEEGGCRSQSPSAYSFQIFHARFQVWRIGLLGNNATSENVEAVLKAVEDGLRHMKSSL